VKSAPFAFIIDLLPKVRGVPQIGFNVNEIAGAMAFLIPLIGGIAVYSWTTQPQKHSDRWHRVFAGVVFCLLWLAAFLGQSRLAIFGILPMLLVITIVLIPRGRWRAASLLCITFFTVLQVLMLGGAFSSQPEMVAERDQDSLSSRLLMWNSGLQIVRDYPLTGSGLNTFRIAAVRNLYPVPGFDRIPHAHNEWVQIATDLGIPGLIVFGGWFVVLGWMLLNIWRLGDTKAKALALAIACGILAHMIFGLGDAIPLWDRFAFVLWWLVGLAMAQHLLVHHAARSVERRV
jgi:O-antigen ligase